MFYIFSRTTDFVIAALLCAFTFISSSSAATLSVFQSSSKIESFSYQPAFISQTENIIYRCYVSSGSPKVVRAGVTISIGDSTESKNIDCDSNDHRTNISFYGSPVVTAALTMFNDNTYSVGVVFEIKPASDTWFSAGRLTTTLAPARDCKLTLPDSVNLGTFTSEQILKEVSSDSKINIAAECNTPFNLTFAGGSDGNGNFLLNDMVMKLSYNRGDNRIVNGQAFTPAASQAVDVDLSAEKGVAPKAGTKTSTLTATLNLL